MKMFKYLTLALAVILVMSACGSAQPAAPGESAPAPAPAQPQDSAGTSDAVTEEPIRIGFFAPLTSAAAAADGLSCQNSVDLAVSLLNESGGINGRMVELVSYDDGLDTTQAISIAERLTTRDNVVAVVSGSYSAPTRVAAPIFQDAGMVMVSSYAVHPDVINAGDFIFSQSFTGSVQGRAGADFMVNNLGKQRIAIIAVDLDFGTELSTSFQEHAESLGATITSINKVAISDNDLAPIITKIRTEDIDAIYMANYYAHSAEVIAQCKLQGLDVPIVASQGTDSWQFEDIAGANAEGMYMTTNMDRDSKNPGAQEFIRKYKETYNMVPDMVGASSYDAMEVLFEAIKAVGTDPAAIRDHIQNLANFETVTGTLIRYTPNGAAVKAVQVQIYKDGAFRHYAEISDPAIITP